MQYVPAIAFARRHARELLRIGWNAAAAGMVVLATWWMLGLPWAERACPTVAQHWIIETVGFITAGGIYAVWLSAAVLIVTYVGAAVARKAAP